MEARVIQSHKVLDPVHVQPDMRVHVQVLVCLPSDRPSSSFRLLFNLDPSLLQSPFIILPVQRSSVIARSSCRIRRFNLFFSADQVIGPPPHLTVYYHDRTEPYILTVIEHALQDRAAHSVVVVSHRAAGPFFSISSPASRQISSTCQIRPFLPWCLTTDIAG